MLRAVQTESELKRGYEMVTEMTGGCFCGAVRYASSSAPRGQSMCHCRMCQRWTGAPAAMTATFPVSCFEYTGDTPSGFRTSPILERQFCSSCGTSLGYRYLVGKFSEVQFILIGTLVNPEQLSGPVHHFGIEDHLEKWVQLEDGLPTYRADTSPAILEAKELASNE